MPNLARYHRYHRSNAIMNVSPESIVVVDMGAVKCFSNSEKRNARDL
jgi:hypothetical protein